jgi:hypothetical protein
MGAAIKKEKVTPRGTPAVTNPINRGTAEQEQNGVTMPSRAAITFPANSLFPERKARVFSGVKKTSDDAHPEDHQEQQHHDLRGIVEEKFHRGPQMGARFDIEQAVGQPASEIGQSAVDQPPEPDACGAHGQIQYKFQCFSIIDRPGPGGTHHALLFYIWPPIDI